VTMNFRNSVWFAMQMNLVAQESPYRHLPTKAKASAYSQPGIEVGLLTGCQDRPYAFGLAMALIGKGVRLDIVGSDEIDSPELHGNPQLRFFNFRSNQRNNTSFVQKLSKLFIYYAHLTRYTARYQPKMLHILWNNKLEMFDRTILMLYYKMLGKKVALTAHNVNQAKRDAKDSRFNRFTLKIQYRLCDHIFVHTQKMKSELCEDFGVPDSVVTVIRHPINDAFPDTDLSPSEAKQKLGLSQNERAILYFGRIRPYKGIEYLIAAFRQLADQRSDYRLVIAGEPKKGSEAYLQEIQETLDKNLKPDQVISKIQFIPDADMELYLKAADVLVLPYKDIFQSGVLFLAYSYGLPVVATDVGSFREEIVEGETGFLCNPGDVVDLAATLEKYFASDLYRQLRTRRAEIKEYARRVHSWDAVADLTVKAYEHSLRS